LAPSIKFRFLDTPIRPDDEDFLFRLYASTRQEEISAWGWNQAQQEAFLRMQFTAQRRWYDVAYVGAEHRLILENRGEIDEPIGRILVRRAKGVIDLVDISLLPGHRNRGIGTALLRELIEESRQSRATVRLQVLRSNESAIRLYRRLGFANVSEDEVRYQMELSHKEVESQKLQVESRSGGS
jgi:ribosomal protein S18 acetylase RimI-like enzyme